MKRLVFAAGLLLPASAAAQSTSGSGFTLSGTPTAPTAPAGTNTNQIATTAFVQANATGLNVSNSLVTSPGMPPRSLSARAADVYNVRDYGALGTNTTTTIAAQFPSSATTSLAAFAAQSVNGSTPYAWMINSAFGLTFSIPTSSDQGGTGTTLNFLEALSGINGWSASVAAWQDPAHGNYLLQPGMQVSGACIAAGTTVASLGRNPGVAGYGTVTLSQVSSTDCASGSLITFTIAPSQLQALTTDWLGIQGAMAAGWKASAGGSVYIPAGNYIVNHSLLNAGGITDSSVQTPNLAVYGSGEAETRIIIPYDLGQDECVLGTATRGTGNASESIYRDLRIIGPSYTAILGQLPAGMDGICLGSNDRADSVNVSNMRAGINGVNDHWSVTNSNISHDGYGVYFGNYSNVIGNQNVENSGIGNETVASIAVSPVNQIDQATFKHVHTGFSPYGFYFEPRTGNVQTGLGHLTNSLFENVFMEAIGNAWIYDPSKVAIIQGNTFIGGGIPLIEVPYSLQNTGSNTTAPALIYVGTFSYNTMVGTQWASYPNLTDAMIEASGNCQWNVWYNDYHMVTDGGNVPPFKCGGNMDRNSFFNSDVSGTFRYNSGAPISPGALMYESGYIQTRAYTDGKNFAGVAAFSAPSNASFPLITSGTQVQVRKANVSQALNVGSHLFPTSGGAALGLDQDGAIAVVTYPSNAGSATVYVDMDPGIGAGGPSSTLGATSAGTSQTTAYTISATNTQFSTVAAGSGAVLAPVPVGKSVAIYNDGANSLMVYPELGGMIGTNSTNAGVSVAAGTSATFKRLSSTRWH